jgi:GNAT superfamily N-acetyltransferase
MILIRQATQADRAALAEMLLRCSRQTRYRRFHGFVESYPEPYFSEALSGHPDHVALVAVLAGRIVALASCAQDELGIVVEDACQRQGLGTRLLAALVERCGYGTLLATIQHDQVWIVPLLRRFSQIKIEIS